MRRLLVIGLVLGASSLAFACSAILGLDPPPQPADDAAADDANDDVHIDPGCPIRYVSTGGGNDGNDGCTIDHAFKTLSAALGAVNAARAPGYDIRMTGGTYAEDNLLVALAGSISGGWDAAFKTQLLATNTGATILQLANPSSTNKVTLTLAPRLTPASDKTRISGLRVNGPAEPNGYAVHVVVPTGSTDIGPLQIDTCNLVGGDADTTRALSVIGATGDIFSNTITSGLGAGAAATELNAGAQTLTAHFHGNTLTAATAPATATVVTNSMALIVANVIATTERGNAIENNTIHIAAAAGPMGTAPLAVGVQVNSNAVLDILKNGILSTGGSLEAESTAGLVGINVGVTSTVRISGNRIFSGGTFNTPGDFYGIKVIGADSAVITNNMIYAGQTKPNSNGGASANGVYIASTASAVIADNSIYTGFPGGTKSAFGIYTAPGQTGVEIQGNILAGSGQSDWGVKAGQCPDGIARLDNNLFVGEMLGPFNIGDCHVDGGPGTPKDIASIKGFVTELSGNVILRGASTDCGTDTTACIVDSRCATSDACDGVVWANFGDDHGVAAFEDGWKLTDGVPCQIANAGITVTVDGGALTKDYYGAARSGMPSIGAAQYPDDAGACSP